ncbi:hypothetical protein S245_004765, partial [Arachis hypogaea]
MCPLRIILIFLSATLAGFFVLRNLRSQPQLNEGNDDPSLTNSAPTYPKPSDSSKFSITKVRAALESGFWSFLDMASGRYLWRHIVSSSTKRIASLCVNLDIIEQNYDRVGLGFLDEKVMVESKAGDNLFLAKMSVQA